MEARCAVRACAEAHFGPAPGGPRSGCGLWALKEPLVDPLQPKVILGLSEGDHAFGRVTMWGRVIPYEHGWRAQFARPIALYRLWPEAKEDEFSVVASGYGIPIEDAPPQLADRVSWWGDTLRPYQSAYRTASGQALLLNRVAWQSQHVRYLPPLPPPAFAAPPPARAWPSARRWFIFWCGGAGINAVGVLLHGLDGGIRWWNIGALLGCALAARNWWRRWKGKR